MSKEILLSQGQTALVDDDDYEWIAQWSWSAVKSHGIWYARRGGRVGEKTSQVKMHRQIMDAKPGEVIDHIDFDGLNNCRANLRICTNQQNRFNQRPHAGKGSPFKGVFFAKDIGFWRACICINRNRIYLGCFRTAEDAARAYDEAAKTHFGEFAYLNFKEAK